MYPTMPHMCESVLLVCVSLPRETVTGERALS